MLGLLREGEGVAARVLKRLGVDPARTRNEILKELDPNFTPPESEAESPQMGDKKDVKTPALRAFGRDLTELAKKGELECNNSSGCIGNRSGHSLFKGTGNKSFRASQIIEEAVRQSLGLLAQCHGPVIWFASQPLRFEVSIVWFKPRRVESLSAYNNSHEFSYYIPMTIYTETRCE